MEVLADARDRGVQVSDRTRPASWCRARLGRHHAGLRQEHLPAGQHRRVSRSGSLGTLLALNLVTRGLGQSVFIGIGGDPILGTTTATPSACSTRTRGTDAIVLVGEIGGRMEEDAAEVSRDHDAGGGVHRRPQRAARPPHGPRGAIVTGSRGSGQSKVDALTKQASR